ncbi:DUF2750 domain-containing protein [Mucilaginibacter ginsenosidivorax]|uniref:DUF2750 domain-containing protein n=1 Tax=Mucilaginibacter ginsenosidivorax TaxID=862126 RepID=A0A5B8W4W7_9SPHI|nr:DUF2750 domain-containing protein [Mucilaginibacter ginsenosidivorax]QEC78025.1 DUF2750 domain-containing protein [Mucilaginibacter ginsenosidivorax]
MLQDIAIIELKYNTFIERAAAARSVWGLKSKTGWANSHSNDDEEVSVIPFWSDRALAKACARDDWKGYLPVEILIAEFLESWCVEMDENDVLAGINWDAKMFGKESPALNVALDILNQLSTNNTAIVFKNYSGVDDFIANINELPDDL